MTVELLEPTSPIDSNDEFHANVKGEVIMKLGMEFETEKEVYDFKNNYARVVGFNIRWSKGHKDGLGKWLGRVFFVVIAKAYKEMTKEISTWNAIIWKQDVVVWLKWKLVIDLVKNIVM